MTKEELEMRKLVRESDVIDRTDGSELAKAFNHLWEKYIEQEPCDDVVSRQAVLDCATLITSIPTEDWDIGDWVCLFRDRVSQLPSVRPQEQTGHWIGIDEEPHEDYECDKCGYVVSTYTANIETHTEYKYCPNCGAKMFEPTCDTCEYNTASFMPCNACEDKSEYKPQESEVQNASSD